MPNTNPSLLRDIAWSTLESYLIYPGRFSILLIGDQGTGKTYAVETLQQKHIKNECFSGINYVYSGLVEDTYSYWQEVLDNSQDKILLLEEVEKLSQKSQDILFDCLSTNTGLFGSYEKTVRCRPVFTSIFSIDQLRDDRRYLSAKFFDRISQFVVKMPNLKSLPRNIGTDFKTTWTKMAFRKKEVCPEVKGDLKAWLEREVDKLHGNFRDLDKIVVNWHNYRLQGLEDNEILIKVKQDFHGYLRNPKQTIYSDNVFVFIQDHTYSEIFDNFRSQLLKWAEKVYGNRKNAAECLKVNKRSIERWSQVQKQEDKK